MMVSSRPEMISSSTDARGLREGGSAQQDGGNRKLLMCVRRWLCSSSRLDSHRHTGATHGGRALLGGLQ